MATESSDHQRHNAASAAYKDETVLHKHYVANKQSAHTIADVYNVTSTTIYYWLRKHGIDRRNPKRRTRYTVLGPDEQDELRRLYVDERLTAHEIAVKYGCSAGTVYNRLQEFNIETNPPLPKDQLQELYCDRDYSMQQVAGELECSRQTVRRSLCKHGLLEKEDASETQ